MRRSHAGQRGQAVMEMALVIVIMLALTLGFVGLMFQVRAQQELSAATQLAARSALLAPLGADGDVYARNTFYRTIGGDTTLQVRGLSCSGGPGSNAAGAVETCRSTAVLDFRNTPIALFWFWSVDMSASGTAAPTPARRCTNPVPGEGTGQC